MNGPNHTVTSLTTSVDKELVVHPFVAFGSNVNRSRCSRCRFAKEVSFEAMVSRLNVTPVLYPALR